MAYLSRGWSPIPIPAGSKAAAQKAWQKLTVAPQVLLDVFTDPAANVGLLLGARSSGLVDIDVDVDVPSCVVAQILPATSLVGGRRMRPGTHFFYVCPAAKPRKFVAPDGTTLVEIRSDGQQTLVAPSVHPTGDLYEWTMFSEPTKVADEQLVERVSQLASVLLLARNWPGVGSRHDFVLALAGYLMAGGLPEDATTTIVRLAACCAGDEETDDRIATVESTTKRMQADLPVAGAGALTDIIGDPRVLDKLAEWLHLKPTSMVREKSTERLSPVERLIRIGRQLHLFHDGSDRAWARLPVSGGGHRATELNSAAFRNYLTRIYLQDHSRPPTTNAFKDAVAAISSYAAYDGPSEEVAVRVARRNDCIWLDLGSEEGTVVEITTGGWREVLDVPVNFARPKGMLALPRPERGGTLVELAQFVNVPDILDRLLLVAWMVTALDPSIPCPILIIGGEQGSAKSTLAKIVQMLIDPNAGSLRTPPDNVLDLVIAGKNARLLAYDNLSSISPKLSDALCRGVTGSGIAGRELYTNAEEVILSFKSAIMLNGISDLATRGDLADRALVLNLPPITEIARQSESHFWTAFEAIRPRLLGSLLDVVARTLHERTVVVLEQKPRMADFAVVGVAVERTLAFSPGSFTKAFDANRSATRTVTLDSQPVAKAILALVGTDRFRWEGTATELLRALRPKAVDLGIDLSSRMWPQSPSALSNAARRAAPDLRGQGVEIEFRKGGKNSERVIVIARTTSGTEASNATATS